MYTRRSCLAAIAAWTAGCSADAPATGTSSSGPSDGGDTGSPDEPELTWTARLPDPVVPLAFASDGNRVAVVSRGNEANGYTATGGTGTGTDGDSPAAGAVFSLRAADGGELWRAAPESTIQDPPVISNGHVHVVVGQSGTFSGRDQRIVSYGRDGERRWATEPRDKSLSIVATNRGTLFAGTSDDGISTTGESLFAIENDGGVRWEREAGDAGHGTVTDGRFLYSGGPSLASYDPADGTRQWKVSGQPVGDPTGSIAAFEGRFFVQSPEDGSLVARSTADGTEQWRYRGPPESGQAFVPTGVAAVPRSDSGTDDGPRFTGTDYGGAVFALHGDGREQWTFTADSDTLAGPVVGDGVYVTDRDGTIYALDPSDGDERWRVSFPNAPCLRPLTDGVLAIATGEGAREDSLVLLREDGSERWRYTASKNLIVAQPVGGRVYAGAADGTVLAFTL